MASAGMMSPSRRRTTSPGTSSRAGMFRHLPPRRTRASSASFFFSASMALSAWYSSQKPTSALSTSSTRMIPKSSQCRTTAERIAAASIIHGIGPQK